MKRKLRAEKVKGKDSIGVSVLLFWLLIAPAAFSQQTGVLEGRLVNATDASVQPANVALEVVSLSGGMSIIRTAEPDSGGKFRIEGLPLDSMLMLRAIYKGANYNKQFSFGPDGVANVEMEIYETTTSENGIEVLPQIRIMAPGSSMPVTQSPLESPDGESYYTQYPMKPGKTAIDVFQILPYKNRKYTYTKKFYYPVSSIEIAVIPMDMDVSGEGLTRVRNDVDNNLAVYRFDSTEKGSIVEWTFTGGTPVAAQESAAASTGSTIRPEPNLVGRNAGFITPVLLLGFILVLWYAMNRIDGNVPENAASRKRLLRERQEVLLNQLADLDQRHKKQTIEPREYQKQREDKKRMLRHVSFLLKQNARR
ncbi:MAG: hypothetical protein P8Z37_14785 [Acidobacteriota bacterium]